VNSRFSYQRSIKNRVTLAALLIFVLSLWSLSLYASHMLKTDLQRLLGEQQLASVSLVADKVTEQLTERITALERAAEQIDATMLRDPKALQSFLAQRPRLSVLFPSGTFITDATGGALASLPASLGRVGQNFMAHEHVAAVLKEGKARISQPMIDKLLQTPTFGIAVPIRDAQGQVIGALAGTVDLSQPNFLNAITHKRYGQTGGYQLISHKDQVYVTATDNTHAMQPVPPVGLMHDTYMHGDEGFGVAVNAHGVEELTAARQIPVATWVLVAALPTREAFAPIRDMQQRMLIATLALTLLAGVLIWWMLRRELLPLRDASDALAAAAASGGQVAPLPIAHLDEVGTLVSGFNRLLGVVQEREAALQRSKHTASENALELALSEQRLGTILDDTKMHLWLYDGSHFTFVNKQWFDFTGHDPAGGLPLELRRSVIHPDDFDATTAVWQKHRASQTEHDNYYRLRRHDGVYRDFHCHMLPVFDAQGTFQYFQAFEQDITERKRAERLEQFRSHILELLAGAATLETILQALVLGVQALRPEVLCSVLQLSADGQHLGQGIAPGLPGFYNAAIDGVQIGVGVGSCGTAAFTGERVIVEDIQTHPYWAPYRELAAQADLAACWSEPIRAATGQVLGTFAIYHRQPHTPDADDIRLIEQSASLASIAIEKRRAANALRTSEQRLALAVSGAQEGIWDMDLLTGALYHSPQLAHMLGYTEEELPANRAAWDAITDPQDRAAFAAEVIKHFKNPGHVFDMLVRLRHKDGSWRWVQSRGHATRNAQGRAVRMSGTQFDATERKLLEDQVRQLAYFDALTGLPNRRMLDDRLNQAMAASKRSGVYGALMFLDLDNFKPLNDAHGHEVGDLLMKEVARRLSTCLREMDTVARFGGDEFVVMLSELTTHKAESTEQARGVAEKIRISVAEPYHLTVSHADQPDTTVAHHCSASIGVVVFVNHEANQSDLMKWADAAMYQAKDAGRNTICFYNK
jgi:diguanylate cyclase (GGDEF)-like protein/PAS domain S-box-containing protein